MPDEQDDRLDEIKKILNAFKAEVKVYGERSRLLKERTAFSVKKSQLFLRSITTRVIE